MKPSIFPTRSLSLMGDRQTDATIRWLARQKDIVSIIQHNRGKWQGKPIERRSWGYFMNQGFKCARGKIGRYCPDAWSQSLCYRFPSRQLLCFPLRDLRAAPVTSIANPASAKRPEMDSVQSTESQRKHRELSTSKYRFGG